MVHAKIAGKILVVGGGANSVVITTADQFRIMWYMGVLQSEEVRFKPPGNPPKWTGVIL